MRQLLFLDGWHALTCLAPLSRPCLPLTLLLPSDLSSFPLHLSLLPHLLGPGGGGVATRSQRLGHAPLSSGPLPPRPHPCALTPCASSLPLRPHPLRPHPPRPHSPLRPHPLRPYSPCVLVPCVLTTPAPSSPVPSSPCPPPFGLFPAAASFPLQADLHLHSPCGLTPCGLTSPAASIPLAPAPHPQPFPFCTRANCALLQPTGKGRLLPTFNCEVFWLPRRCLQGSHLAVASGNSLCLNAALQRLRRP